MKDVELRGIILRQYYENRRGQLFLPKPNDFIPPIASEDILAISDQLAEHRLLEWKVIRRHGKIAVGLGKITAFGINVVEGEATPDIKVEFVHSKTVNVTGSSNVVVGNHNNLTINQHVSELARLIDDSDGTVEQKAEAKSLLRRFVEHPLITSVAGGAIGLFGS